MKYKSFLFLIILMSAQIIYAERFSPFCLDSGKSCRRPMAMGIYSEKANKTFICWAYSGMDLGIIEYNHTTGRWSEKKILKGMGKNDYHAYPTMVRDKNGYLHIFSSLMGKKSYVCYKSKAPDSITEWESKKIPPLGNKKIGLSYIMPLVYDKTGEIFLFARALFPEDDYYASNRRYVMLKMNPVTSEWTEPQTIISFNNPDNNNSPYIGKIVFAPETGNYPDRFIISWTTCNGHPKSEPVKFNNVYSAYLSLDKAEDENKYKLYNAASKPLGNIIDEGKRKDVIVFNTGNKPYRSIDYFVLSEYDSEGKTEIIFRYKKMPLPSKKEVNLLSARLINNRWFVKKINDKQYYFVYDFYKKDGKDFISVLDFSRHNQFMSSESNLTDWQLVKEFSFYKSMKQVFRIPDCREELRFFSKISKNSYKLSHNQPCFVYGNLKPQLLCCYTFDSQSGKTVKDFGLYEVDGTMAYPQKGEGKSGKAFLSTPKKPNTALFPHATQLVNDFTVSFYIKPSSIPTSESNIISASEDLGEKGWLLRGGKSLQFKINAPNGSSAKASIPQFFESAKDKWTKVTAIYKSGEYIKLFVNGECKAVTKTSIGSIAYSDKSLLKLGSEEFFGMIDDVRICDGIELNPEKLKLYNKTQ